MTNEEARDILRNWMGCAKANEFCACEESCDGCEFDYDSNKCEDAMDTALEALEKQSELVHCKDCKYWVRATIKGFHRTPQVPACELAGWLCGEDGFCLYGVRKVEHEID